MQDQFLLQFAPLIAIFAIMYFLVLRPQQQKMKDHRQMIENVRRGDMVVTGGGILGKVAKVPQADDPELVIEIAEGVQVKVLRSTLADVRAKGQPVETKTEKKG